jgi:hypothetical protein
MPSRRDEKDNAAMAKWLHVRQKYEPHQQRCEILLMHIYFLARITQLLVAAMPMICVGNEAEYGKMHKINSRD